MSPSYLAVSSDGGQEEVTEMPAATVCGYDDAASDDDEREDREDHGHAPTGDPRRDGSHYLLDGFAVIVYISVVWHCYSILSNIFSKSLTFILGCPES